MIKFLASLLRPAALLLEGNTAIGTIVAVAGQILTAVVSMWTQVTTWIVGDNLALLYLGMMIITFVFMGVLLLVKKG